MGVPHPIFEQQSVGELLRAAEILSLPKVY